MLVMWKEMDASCTAEAPHPLTHVQTTLAKLDPRLPTSSTAVTLMAMAPLFGTSRALHESGNGTVMLERTPAMQSSRSVLFEDALHRTWADASVPWKRRENCVELPSSMAAVLDLAPLMLSPFVVGMLWLLDAGQEAGATVLFTAAGQGSPFGTQHTRNALPCQQSSEVSPPTKPSAQPPVPLIAQQSLSGEHCSTHAVAMQLSQIRLAVRGTVEGHGSVAGTQHTRKALSTPALSRQQAVEVSPPI
jgi:hypothetical protein